MPDNTIEINGVEFDADELRAGYDAITVDNGDETYTVNERYFGDTLAMSGDGDTDTWVTIIGENGAVHTRMGRHDIYTPKHRAQKIVDEETHRPYRVVKTGDRGADDHDFFVYQPPPPSTCTNEEPLATLLDTFSLSYVETVGNVENTLGKYTDKDIDEGGVAFFFEA